MVALCHTWQCVHSVEVSFYDARGIIYGKYKSRYGLHTDLRALFDRICILENRGLCSSAIMYVYIYIYRKISFCFLLLLGIFEYIANEIFSSLISIVSNFHPMINLEDRVLNIYIYIGNFFENYAIQVFNSPGVTKRGI